MKLSGTGKKLLYYTKGLVPFWGLFLILGCQTAGRQVQNPMPVEILAKPEMTTPQKAYEGTLWKTESSFSSLFSNPKATYIGDIVTIKIVETASASNQATTSTGRQSSLSGQIDAFFNLENKYANAGNNLNPFGQVAGGIDNNFSGNGATTRKGDLSAHITAKVVDVLPNGNLIIVGTRQVQINNETQYIALSGTIRPRDISPENVILSTYISDAKITYSGKGVVNDRQKPGWMANILEKAWPF